MKQSESNSSIYKKAHENKKICFEFEYELNMHIVQEAKGIYLCWPVWGRLSTFGASISRF